MPSDATLYRAHKDGATYQELAQQHGLKVDSIRSRVSRERRRTLNLTAEVKTFAAPAIIGPPTGTGAD